MSIFRTLFSVLIFLTSFPLHAGDAPPPLPMALHNACEGEDCWMASEGLGWMTSDTTLHARQKPLDRSHVAFVVPSGARFEVLAHDLYILTTRPIRLAPHDGRDHHPACGDTRIKLGDIIYPLYYAGEGWYGVWYKGAPLECWEPLPSHMDAKQINRVQIWLQIRYDGREGWWGQPLHCRSAFHESNCPIIIRAYPLPSWLQMAWRAMYKARAF